MDLEGHVDGSGRERELYKHENGREDRSDDEDARTDPLAADGSVDGTDDGNASVRLDGSTGGSPSRLNSSFSNSSSREPRKLQRPIQRGAQACKSLSHSPTRSCSCPGHHRTY